MLIQKHVTLIMCLDPMLSHKHLSARSQFIMVKLFFYDRFHSFRHLSIVTCIYARCVTDCVLAGFIKMSEDESGRSREISLSLSLPSITLGLNSNGTDTAELYKSHIVIRHQRRVRLNHQIRHGMVN